MNSDRSRIRVIGVRRSWLMAASILVRSSIRPFLELLKESQSSSTSYGSTGTTSTNASFSALLIDFQS